MKSNNMPTNRLPIKFSKTAFFNILKYAIKRACLFVCNHVPNQPTTFKFPQSSFGKTNPVKRIFQASWFTNRTPPDETYRGVEIVVHSSVLGLETRLIKLHEMPVHNFISKNGLKMHQNRFYRHLKFFNFLGGDPPNPPLVLFPLSRLRPSALAERLCRSMTVPPFEKRRRPCNSSGYKMYQNNIKGYNVYALWFNWTMLSISLFSFC